MRIQKKTSGVVVSPHLPERGFFTEADIRIIIRDAVQEAVAALMTEDENMNSCDESDHPIPGEKLTLSVQEAADLIGISKPKMFDLLHSGEISYKRIGKKIIISHQTIVDWVNQ